MADEDNKRKKKSKKPSKKLLYFLIILIVVLAEGFILCCDYATNEDSLLEEISQDYPVLNNVLRYIPADLIGVPWVLTLQICQPFKSRQRQLEKTALVQ